MDSPGNDLESIAGQVAAGSNMIFFVTGNGSITNFPFVPTIKIVTHLAALPAACGRHGRRRRGLPGRHPDGGARRQPLRTHPCRRLRSAVARREQAGHSQVSIWRNWPQRDRLNLETLLAAPCPSGEPHPIATEAAPEIRFRAAVANQGSTATDRVGLVLPTSLCAGQIARLTAERLNARAVGAEKGITRFVSLVHTEGCGVTGYDTEGIYARTLVGYLSHPLVSVGLLMEHGCEKTHNDYFREQLKKMGRSEAEFGWASVQMDGGIESVINGVESWFTDRIETMEGPRYAEVGLESLRLGMICSGPLGDSTAAAFSQLCRWIAGAGGHRRHRRKFGPGSEPGFQSRVGYRRPAPQSRARGAPFPAGILLDGNPLGSLGRNPDRAWSDRGGGRARPRRRTPDADAPAGAGWFRSAAATGSKRTSVTTSICRSTSHSIPR